MDTRERRMPTLQVVGILLSIAIVGMGFQVWLAPVPATEMTPAQQSILTTADWMVKSAGGAVIGFMGARLGG